MTGSAPRKTWNDVYDRLSELCARLTALEREVQTAQANHIRTREIMSYSVATAVAILAIVVTL